MKKALAAALILVAGCSKLPGGNDGAEAALLGQLTPEMAPFAGFPWSDALAAAKLPDAQAAVLLGHDSREIANTGGLLKDPVAQAKFFQAAVQHPDTAVARSALPEFKRLDPGARFPAAVAILLRAWRQNWLSLAPQENLDPAMLPLLGTIAFDILNELPALDREKGLDLYLALLRDNRSRFWVRRLVVQPLAAREDELAVKTFQDLLANPDAPFYVSGNCEIARAAMQGVAGRGTAHPGLNEVLLAAFADRTPCRYYDDALRLLLFAGNQETLRRLAEIYGHLPAPCTDRLEWQGQRVDRSTHIKIGIARAVRQIAARLQTTPPALAGVPENEGACP